MSEEEMTWNQISQSFLLFFEILFSSSSSFFFFSLFLLVSHPVGDVPAWLDMSGTSLTDQSRDQWPQSSISCRCTEVCHIFGETCVRKKIYINKSEVSWPSSQIKFLAPPSKWWFQGKSELIISTALSVWSEHKTHWETTAYFPKVEGGGSRKKTGVVVLKIFLLILFQLLDAWP